MWFYRDGIAEWEVAGVRESLCRFPRNWNSLLKKLKLVFWQFFFDKTEIHFWQNYQKFKFMINSNWCFSKTFRFFSCRSLAAFSIMSCKSGGFVRRYFFTFLQVPGLLNQIDKVKLSKRWKWHCDNFLSLKVLWREGISLRVWWQLQHSIVCHKSRS